MDERNSGIWIIDVQKHLQEFIGPELLTTYDTTIVSGQCGRLVGRIRKHEIIQDLGRLIALAAPLGISPSALKGVVIPTLEKRDILTVHRDNTGAITKIDEYAPPVDDIPKITHEIWRELNPNSIEEATLSSQETCATMPRMLEDLKNELANEGYTSDTVESALDLQNSCDLLAFFPPVKEKTDRQLVYSEYVWGRNATKIAYYLSHLEKQEKGEVTNLLTTISHNQAIPVEHLSTTNDILGAARKVGLIDGCQVQTRTGVRKEFVFTPRMWGAFSGQRLIDDLDDDVKTLLACIKFGQLYSQASKIRDPTRLLEVLIEKGSVGPASAIGTDYPILEYGGIVKVEKDQGYSDRYNMHLVKDDIAKVTLDILRHQRISGLDGSLDGVDSLCQSGRFLNPEQDRIRMKKPSKESARAGERLIRILRGEVG